MNNTILRLLVFVSIAFLISCSSGRYLDLIEKQKYGRAEKRINKRLAKNPDDVALNYTMAVLLIERDYKNYNAKESYNYLINSLSLFEKTTDESVLNSLNKVSINKTSFHNLTDTICKFALEDAVNNNKVEDFEEYLEYFEKASNGYKNKALHYRNVAAFTRAKDINSVESYQDFINSYPNANQIETAIKKRNALAFMNAKEIDQVSKYKQFIIRYPNAIEVEEAWSRIHEIEFENAVNANTAIAYLTFTIEYPNSKQYNKALELYEERLFYEKTVSNNYESYKQFVKLYPDNRFIYRAVDSVLVMAKQLGAAHMYKFAVKNSTGEKFQNTLQEYYNLISFDGELSTLEEFYVEFSDYISLIDNFESDLEKAIEAEKIGLTTSTMHVMLENDNEELNKRLIREGAKSGAIQISLMWDNYNDLDLHCIDPNREHIYFKNKKARSGGELDVDMNVSPESMAPVENIYWPDDKAPEGMYFVYLDYYSNHRCGADCLDPTQYLIRIKINNRNLEFRGEISRYEGNKLIYSFNYKKPTPYGVALTKKQKKNLENYIEKSAPNELAFVALQKLIARSIDEKKYKEALNIIERFEDYFENFDKVTKLKKIIEADSDPTIKINSLSHINTIKGSEYSPVISANNQLIYFCGKDRRGNRNMEDIYVSAKRGNNWSTPELVKGLSSDFSNDAPMALSTDGNSILMFKNGKIGFSRKTISGWSDIQYFPEAINAGTWNGDAMLTSDGNALIFASDREGNFNYSAKGIEIYHGENNYPTDIYVSLRNNNTWSKPINLGSAINTVFSERSPFLHPDMKTLYFSSDGHSGLGKYDVFKSTRLGEDCWDCWSEPENLGKDINTVGDDWGYKISTDGKDAYYAAINAATGNYDIYHMSLPIHLRPGYVATVAGQLHDRENNPIDAEIIWEDLDSGVNIGRSRSNPLDGSFFIVLPLGKIYGYYVDKDDYYPIANYVDLRESDEPIELEKNIDMVTFKEMIEEGIAVPINNLFFNFAEASLLPFSLSELRRVARIIISNNLSVEISGHTDNIGNQEQNQVLSEKRAQAVKDFLIKEGCNADNLSIKGFGMARPIAPNTTDEGRAKNRRVELKFIE